MLTLSRRIELHPLVWKEAEPILAYQKKHSIATAAYGSLSPATKSSGGALDAVLTRIAEKHSLSGGASHVLLLWALSKAEVVVTTSSKEWRLKETLALVDEFKAGKKGLTEEEVKEIDEVGKKSKISRSFMPHMSE